MEPPKACSTSEMVGVWMTVSVNDPRERLAFFFPWLPDRVASAEAGQREGYYGRP